VSFFVIGYWLLVIGSAYGAFRRLKEVGSRQSAVGSIGAFGDVASRKSQVARSVAFGDGIGHWALGIGSVINAVIGILVYWYIGGRALALHFAGMNSRLQKHALQSNTTKFSIECSEKLKRFFIVILNSIQDPRSNGYSEPWIPGQARNDGSFSEDSILNSQFSIRNRFLTPHSSLLTPFLPEAKK